MSGTIHNGGAALRSARAYLLERHGPRPTCGRCGELIDTELPGTHPRGLTVGHVIPVSRGGNDARSNLRPEHGSCNNAARDRVDPPRATIARPHWRMSEW